MFALAFVAALCAAAGGIVEASGAGPTGRLVYMSFDSTTTLKQITLSGANHPVTALTKFADETNYPTWSESSARDLNTTYFYNFYESDGNGTLVGVNVMTKKVLFRHPTPYFWRVAYDPTSPEAVFGLWIGDNNVYLTRVNKTNGEMVTIGAYPDGFTSPSNSAVYDSSMHTFYAFLSDGSSTKVFGMDATTGDVVTTATVSDDYYVCESVRDDATGVFYAVVMDSDSNVWLGNLNPHTGAIKAVGTGKLAASACDADSALSSAQGLYFAYVKDNSGNSVMTVWSLATGALVQKFDVENAVFGMQLFE